MGIIDGLRLRGGRPPFVDALRLRGVQTPFFGGFRRRGEEEKPETVAEADDLLLKALMNEETITREKALTLPAVSAATDFICSSIAAMPVRLYRKTDGKVEELSADPRVGFLNGDTGDTLDAFQMKRAAVEDYLLGKGGYLYIRRGGNTVTGLFYVREEEVSAVRVDDPVFKDYRLLVNGRYYEPWDFVKLLRATRDGAAGVGLTEEVGKAIETAYRMLLYQLAIARSGGGKRGFLKSKAKMTQESIDRLKKAWREMYEDKTENVVILNNGLEFQEATASSTEMQLNQSKNALTAELNALFHIYPSDLDRTFKEAIFPILRAFETALNRDLLLEREKSGLYFEFDCSEILKLSLQERYTAYKVAKDTGFLTVNEIRQRENLSYIEGMDVLNVGLSAVLYDTEKHVYYTPNTGEVSDLKDAEKTPGGLPEPKEKGQPSEVSSQTSEVSSQTSEVSGQTGEERSDKAPKDHESKKNGQNRFNPNHDLKGKFAPADHGGGGGAVSVSSAGSAPSAGSAAAGSSPTASSASAPVKSKRGKDVTEEYRKNARPGVGNLSAEDGYDESSHPREIETAHLLIKRIGGDITLINESPDCSEKRPDYLWNDKYWDEKSPTTVKAANSAVKGGMSQIKKNPGGVVLNYREHSFPIQEIIDVIDKRMQWKRIKEPVDIMIIMDGQETVIRYE